MTSHADTRTTVPVALVTGSGRQRVGNVVARALAERGFAIALHYRHSADSAQMTLRDFRNQGIDCEAFQADVAIEADVQRMFDQLIARFGRLDVLVTTASIWEPCSLEQVTAETLLRNFQINAMGTFLCAQRAGLLMARQPEGGSIITLGDWAIERPGLDYSAYFVSKGALPTLTRTLAVELAHRNPKVRVNCLHPGPVMFAPTATVAQQQELIDATLVKSANCPESIAQAVLSLVDNPFITGVCLPVDGGRTISGG
jgi:pteridine reductase